MIFKVLAILGAIMPSVAIAISLVVYFWQTVTTNGGSIQVVISGGCLGVCGTLLWQASSFKTMVVKAIQDMVTVDKMERRLAEERSKSDNTYLRARAQGAD